MFILLIKALVEESLGMQGVNFCTKLQQMLG